MSERSVVNWIISQPWMFHQNHQIWTCFYQQKLSLYFKDFQMFSHSFFLFSAFIFSFPNLEFSGKSSCLSAPLSIESFHNLECFIRIIKSGHVFISRMAWPRDWGALDCKHNSTGFTQGRSTKRACFWIQTSAWPGSQTGGPWIAKTIRSFSARESA